MNGNPSTTRGIIASRSSCTPHSLHKTSLVIQVPTRFRVLLSNLDKRRTLPDTYKPWCSIPGRQLLSSPLNYLVLKANMVSTTSSTFDTLFETFEKSYTNTVPAAALMWWWTDSQFGVRVEVASLRKEFSNGMNIGRGESTH